MKNANSPQEAKIYKIQLNKLVITSAIAVIVFCVISTVFNFVQMLSHGISNVQDALKYPFLILVSLFCIALALGALIKSQYVIQGQYLVSQFGFIKSKYDIKKFTAVILDTDTNKLTVNCNEEFFIISVNKEWNESFVRDLLTINPHIDYSFTLSENKK